MCSRGQRPAQKRSNSNLDWTQEACAGSRSAIGATRRGCKSRHNGDADERNGPELRRMPGSARQARALRSSSALCDRYLTLRCTDSNQAGPACFWTPREGGGRARGREGGRGGFERTDGLASQYPHLMHINVGSAHAIGNTSWCGEATPENAASCSHRGNPSASTSFACIPTPFCSKSSAI